MVDRPFLWQAVHGTDPRGGAKSMMIKGGVRGDHTADARSAPRPGRAASAGTAFAGQPVTQTLNPPPPLVTCKTVGKRVICDGARTEPSGPDHTGIAVLQASDRFGIPRERLMDSRWLGPGRPFRDEAPPRSPSSGRRAWPRGSANCD